MQRHERERTTFQSQGQIRTADGRELDISVDLAMERETSQQVELSLLMDPLVINFDGGVAELAAGAFAFDLDADGTEEWIPRFCANSGYLACDENQDGVIKLADELNLIRPQNLQMGYLNEDVDLNGVISLASELNRVRKNALRATNAK